MVIVIIINKIMINFVEDLYLSYIFKQVIIIISVNLIMIKINFDPQYFHWIYEDYICFSSFTYPYFQGRIFLIIHIHPPHFIPKILNLILEFKMEFTITINLQLSLIHFNCSIRKQGHQKKFHQDFISIRNEKNLNQIYLQGYHYQMNFFMAIIDQVHFHYYYY